DGCLLSDFARHEMRLCDLDLYREGPYVLDSDRQYGSTRFMAPEEFQRGATIDERTTLFTLGRAAFVLLGPSPRGETELEGWKAGDALYQVAMLATEQGPADRYHSVAALVSAWRA